MLISNQRLPSLLIPLLPLLSALVNKMLHLGNPPLCLLPMSWDALDNGQMSLGYFPAPFEDNVSSLTHYFSELLPCKATLFVHGGLGALGRELFLKSEANANMECKSLSSKCFCLQNGKRTLLLNCSLRRKLKLSALLLQKFQSICGPNQLFLL